MNTTDAHGPGADGFLADGSGVELTGSAAKAAYLEFYKVPRELVEKWDAEHGSDERGWPLNADHP